MELEIEQILEEASAYNLRIEVQRLAEELWRHFPQDHLNRVYCYERALRVYTQDKHE